MFLICAFEKRKKKKKKLLNFEESVSGRIATSQLSLFDEGPTWNICIQIPSDLCPPLRAGYFILSSFVFCMNMAFLLCCVCF